MLAKLVLLSDAHQVLDRMAARNLYLIFRKLKIWEWCPTHMESPSIFSLPKRGDLWNFIFEIDLLFACRWPLCIFILSNWQYFCKIGQFQTDHFDVFLPTMQKVQKVWFRVWLPMVLKVSLIMFWSEMTLCKMLIFLFPLFDLATFSKFVLGLWMCSHTLHNGNKAKTSLHVPTY